MSYKKITILGCGWVGEALKKRLILKGNEVNCLSRDIDKNILLGLYTCDSCIIAIPPSDKYLEVIEDTLSLIDLYKTSNTQIIFLSSISFYNKKNSIIEAENLVKTKDNNTVILRLGGLMGYDRIAGKYTQNKTIENKPTNYVHRDDVVGIIENIIKTNIKNKIFDVVAPVQSTRKQIFLQNSQQFGFKKTYFSRSVNIKKVYSSDILCDALDYKFKKDDVRNFWK